MEGTKNKIEFLGILFFYIIYSVGIAGHIINPTRELMILLTPFTLLLSSLVLFYFLWKEESRKLFVWLSATYFITFSLEVIGVKTGIIFGSYNYGNVLGVKLLETPLIIGLNWVFVIFGAYILTLKITSKKIFLPIMTAFLALAFDYFMEPVAIYLNYWTWDGSVIPLQNYAAWFIIAFFFASILSYLKVEIKGKIFADYFVIQFFFFVILNLVIT